MKFQDRLYGLIELPPLAHELAETCPVLLRLREVRMANIPFASYPSFANVSRFEHSLGVAHLAWRFARAQQLPEDEAIAVTLAALYHDGASPAFGHLYEELLIAGGFDHEQALAELLTGASELNGKADAQIFLGRRCRLRAKLPIVEDGTALSCQGVSQILAGTHHLSPIIVGSIDLDNIDNVIRAATAMGVAGGNVAHPYEVLAELVIENRVLRRVGERAGILRWQEARRRLYGAILGNSFEFRAQSAIKWAISEAATIEPDLSESKSWTLTEPELVFEHLRRHPSACRLVDSVRLGQPPELHLLYRVSDISPLLKRGGAQRMRAVCEEAEALVGYPLFCNFYKDKAERPVTLASPEESQIPASANSDESCSPGVIGLFRGWSEGKAYSRQRRGPQRASKKELTALLRERLSVEPLQPADSTDDQLSFSA